MLTVNDPLRNKVVTVTAQVLPVEDGDDEENRPALVSVGVAGQKPTMLRGTYGMLMATIQEAWDAHSQITLTAAPATEEVIAEGKLAPATTQASIYDASDF